ncbi:MAG: flagellar biosynthetic protein FliR [Burkholderiaceae bacterium]
MISFSDAQFTTLIASYLLPLFRIIGLFTAAPVLSQRTMPAKARVATALAITILIAPTVAVPVNLATTDLLPLVIHEVTIGLMMGFFARLIFSAFEVAGETIGLQMGLSFAGFFDPQSGASNPVSRLLNLTALTGFVVLNGPGLLLAAIVASFSTIPIGLNWTFIAVSSPIHFGSAMFSLALAIALPFMILLLFVNLALGIMSRVAPQFSVFVVGFPLTIGAGLILLTLSISSLDVPLSRAMELMLQAISL